MYAADFHDPRYVYALVGTPGHRRYLSIDGDTLWVTDRTAASSTGAGFRPLTPLG